MTNQHFRIKRYACLLSTLLPAFVFTTVKADYFSPLDDLVHIPASQSIGGQNFTRCCLQAMKAWKDDGERTDVSIWSNKDGPNPFNSPDELAKADEQFPCGASYTGDDAGASRVIISYNWCTANCGGWHRSTNKVLTEWVQPFVGFILPAAVFCLNVPRKMVVEIADGLFPDILEKLKYSWMSLIDYKGEDALADTTVAVIMLVVHVLLNGILVVIRAGIAALLGLINVLVWVIIVFSTAGPMIVSGLYEAAVDRRVLHGIEHLVRQPKRNHVEDSVAHPYANDVSKITYEVHMLYAILVGNLQLPRKEYGSSTAASGPTDVEKAQAVTPPANRDDLAWDHVAILVRKTVHASTAAREATETRLNRMLECQASFGSTIGAPVAFFLGSFLFSVFSNFNDIGNGDTSSALSFGEWWMTIPHVAIVAGCLLAGNNPNTLEIMMSGLRWADGGNDNIPSSSRPTNEAATIEEDNAIGAVKELRKSYITPFYKSIYQPVWMWERGRSKRNWVDGVQKLYGIESTSQAPAAGAEEVRHEKRSFKDRLRSRLDISRGADIIENVSVLSPAAWALLLGTASILVIIPWVLAYINSFYSPPVGLSCRSFTYVLYFLFQLLLTVIWLVDFRRETHYPLFTKKRPTFFFLITLFAFTGAAFTTTFGTFFQVVGVYRNCRCLTPMSAWGVSVNSNFVISTNFAEKISYAKKYWLADGIASIVLLIFFCYLGWWYQKHWRSRFTKVVKDVLMTHTLADVARLRKELLDDRQRRLPPEGNVLLVLQRGEESGGDMKPTMAAAVQPAA